MRTRRTKNQIEKDKYNSEVDAYNWYVVNLDTKRAETGFEFKEDAVDLLNDYDDKKKYKVVSKRALKSMGVENPNESFKYEDGGDFQAGVYVKGGSIKKEIAFKIQNDYIGYLDLGFYNITLADDYVAYNSFFNLSDATKELFDYLKSDDGIAICKYNPKSNFSILKLYASGKKDYRGDNEIIDKTVFKISAKEIDNLRSIRRLENGGYFDGSIPKVSTYMTNYAKGGTLQAHGIEVGDTFIKTIMGGIQKVKDKNGKIVYINLSTGERDSQPPLPFAMGGYTDLSKEKPEVINESESEKEDSEILEAIQTLQSLLNDSSKKDNDEIVNNNSISKDGVEIPEIDIEKIKMIDLNITNNKILSLEDTIRVLKQLYDKGSINAYEEVKILYLDNSNKVIGVYTHSKGGIAGTIVDIEMICGLALKCLAKGVIMSHNHPSGSLIFSPADIQVTKELKNALNLFKIALLDSVIITDNGYQSMTTQGILANGGSLSRFDNGGKLIGNQKSIDLNHNGKIDAEDFKLLRSTMNGAWRNEHEHVNSTSRKNGKVIEYEVRYARKNNPSRKGYKGKTNYATGGGVDDNEIQFINYKDEEIMYEPNYSEYFVNDEQFMSLEEAKDYIDKGSRMSNKTINAYRKGAFADGGGVGQKDSVYFKPTILQSEYPNFLTIIVKYPTGEGFLTALGQKTSSGQKRDNGQIKANVISKSIVNKLNKEFNIEDIDVSDNKNGKVVIFSVSDDFVGLPKNIIEQKLKTNSFAKGGAVYNKSKYLTKEEWQKVNDYAKTGKVNGKVEKNIFTVSRLINVPVSKMNAYWMEQRNKSNAFADGGKVENVPKEGDVIKNVGKYGVRIDKVSEMFVTWRGDRGQEEYCKISDLKLNNLDDDGDDDGYYDNEENYWITSKPYGYLKGGGISKFQKLSKSVAKNYEGKRVKPQYQKEYGKVYSKDEAKEVGNKVAGKVKLMRKNTK